MAMMVKTFQVRILSTIFMLTSCSCRQLMELLRGSSVFNNCDYNYRWVSSSRYYVDYMYCILLCISLLLL